MESACVFKLNFQIVSDISFSVTLLHQTNLKPNLYLVMATMMQKRHVQAFIFLQLK